MTSSKIVSEAKNGDGDRNGQNRHQDYCCHQHIDVTEQTF